MFLPKLLFLALRVSIGGIAAALFASGGHPLIAACIAIAVGYWIVSENDG
jgi:hypothetical protein